QMILIRFLEAFSPSSEEERMQVEFTDETNIFTWKACRNISLGWKSITREKSLKSKEISEDKEETLAMLPNITEGEVLPLLTAEITEYKTKPKSLYTDASLLSAMEN